MKALAKQPTPIPLTGGVSTRLPRHRTVETPSTVVRASRSESADSSDLSRRSILGAMASVAPLSQILLPSPAHALDGFDYYEAPSGLYTVFVPANWTKKSKAGADILWEDPEKTSNNIGITVTKVRIENLPKFGSLSFVGRKLVDTEKAKDGTLNVTLLHSLERKIEGITYYDYEYELESTRGRKRIFNTVTILDSNLFIVNGQHKCEKGDPDCLGAVPIAKMLRKTAETFRVY